VCSHLYTFTCVCVCAYNHTKSSFSIPAQHVCVREGERVCVRVRLCQFLSQYVCVCVCVCLGVSVYVCERERVRVHERACVCCASASVSQCLSLSLSQSHELPLVVHFCLASKTTTSWIIFLFGSTFCIGSPIDSGFAAKECGKKRYGVVTISRLLKIMGLFCKRAL